MDIDYIISLVEKLRSYSDETEWVEFKVNNAEPELIGEYISAISNSAALHEKEWGYLVWGIDDKTHEIIGTELNYRSKKVGNEEIENWLSTQLKPRLDFRFYDLMIEDKKVVIMFVPAANNAPTSFKSEKYIRVGSYKKKLKDYPDKEKNLWRSFDIRPFETMIAKENVDAQQVTELIDCAAFYTLMNLPLPSNRDSMMHDMLDYEFIKTMDNGNYAITNMGALLFAKDLKKFDRLFNKAIRVIKYKGNGKTEATHDDTFKQGYAVCFEEVIRHCMTLLTQYEVIETAFNEKFIMFPEKAVREVLGNLCIHQDLTLKGQGPVIEIFDTKIEATSMGALLIEPDRIIDSAPHARNEKMAQFLRLIHICEARGSGFDRMEEGMRDLKIPAPKVESGEDFCRILLYWHKSFADWSKEERIKTCYIYVCYCYVNEIPVTNVILRERFGLGEESRALVSKVIKATADEGLIKLFDDTTAPRYYRYIPYWA